jgi:tRNA(Ile)-lysidine synthase TilS/MesJ
MGVKSFYRRIDLVNKSHKLISNNLIKQKDQVLLSFSGGQDSICLLFMLNQLYSQLELHITFFWCHHLWQTDSFYLMQQVAKLSFLFQFNSCFAIPSSFISSELLARKWRQSCSYRVSFFSNNSKICLAHTFNDKVETIFFNFMRGTGLTKLSPLRRTQLISKSISTNEKHVFRYTIASDSIDLDASLLTSAAWGGSKAIPLAKLNSLLSHRRYASKELNKSINYVNKSLLAQNWRGGATDPSNTLLVKEADASLLAELNSLLAELRNQRQRGTASLHPITSNLLTQHLLAQRGGVARLHSFHPSEVRSSINQSFHTFSVPVLAQRQKVRRFAPIILLAKRETPSNASLVKGLVQQDPFKLLPSEASEIHQRLAKRHSFHPFNADSEAKLVRSYANKLAFTNEAFTSLMYLRRSPTAGSLPRRGIASLIFDDRSRETRGEMNVMFCKKRLRSACTDALLAQRQRGDASLLVRSEASELRGGEIDVVRPLLFISRFEIKQICSFWRLPLYPDTSNQKVKFLRNRIRQQLLPTIKLFFNSKIEDSFLQLAEIVEAEDYRLTEIVNKFTKNTDVYDAKLRTHPTFTLLDKKGNKNSYSNLAKLKLNFITNNSLTSLLLSSTTSGATFISPPQGKEPEGGKFFAQHYLPAQRLCDSKEFSFTRVRKLHSFHPSGVRSSINLLTSSINPLLLAKHWRASEAEKRVGLPSRETEKLNKPYGFSASLALQGLRNWPRPFLSSDASLPSRSATQEASEIHQRLAKRDPFGVRSYASMRTNVAEPLIPYPKKVKGEQRVGAKLEVAGAKLNSLQSYAPYPYDFSVRYRQGQKLAKGNKKLSFASIGIKSANINGVNKSVDDLLMQLIEINTFRNSVSIDLDAFFTSKAPYRAKQEGVSSAPDPFNADSEAKLVKGSGALLTPLFTNAAFTSLMYLRRSATERYKKFSSASSATQKAAKRRNRSNRAPEIHQRLAKRRSCTSLMYKSLICNSWGHKKLNKSVLTSAAWKGSEATFISPLAKLNSLLSHRRYASKKRRILYPSVAKRLRYIKDVKATLVRGKELNKSINYVNKSLWCSCRKLIDTIAFQKNELKNPKLSKMPIFDLADLDIKKLKKKFAKEPKKKKIAKLHSFHSPYEVQLRYADTNALLAELRNQRQWVRRPAMNVASCEALLVKSKKIKFISLLYPLTSTLGYLLAQRGEIAKQHSFHPSNADSEAKLVRSADASLPFTSKAELLAIAQAGLGGKNSINLLTSSINPLRYKGRSAFQVRKSLLIPLTPSGIVKLRTFTGEALIPLISIALKGYMCHSSEASEIDQRLAKRHHPFNADSEAKLVRSCASKELEAKRCWKTFTPVASDPLLAQRQRIHRRGKMNIRNLACTDADASLLVRNRNQKLDRELCKESGAEKLVAATQIPWKYIKGKPCKSLRIYNPQRLTNTAFTSLMYLPTSLGYSAAELPTEGYKKLSFTSTYNKPKNLKFVSAINLSYPVGKQSCTKIKKSFTLAQCAYPFGSTPQLTFHPISHALLSAFTSIAPYPSASKKSEAKTFIYFTLSCFAYPSTITLLAKRETPSNASLVKRLIQQTPYRSVASEQEGVHVAKRWSKEGAFTGETELFAIAQAGLEAERSGILLAKRNSVQKGQKQMISRALYPYGFSAPYPEGVSLRYLYGFSASLLPYPKRSVWSRSITCNGDSKAGMESIAATGLRATEVKIISKTLGLGKELKVMRKQLIGNKDITLFYLPAFYYLLPLMKHYYATEISFFSFGLLFSSVLAQRSALLAERQTFLRSAMNVASLGTKLRYISQFESCKGGATLLRKPFISNASQEATFIAERRNLAKLNSLLSHRRSASKAFVSASVASEGLRVKGDWTLSRCANYPFPSEASKIHQKLAKRHSFHPFDADSEAKLVRSYASKGLKKDTYRNSGSTTINSIWLYYLQNANTEIKDLYFFKFFLYFFKLRLKKRWIYWPNRIVCLPLAFHRRIIKLFLLKQNKKNIRYSKIDLISNNLLAISKTIAKQRSSEAAKRRNR